LKRNLTAENRLGRKELESLLASNFSALMNTAKVDREHVEMDLSALSGNVTADDKSVQQYLDSRLASNFSAMKNQTVREMGEMEDVENDIWDHNDQMKREMENVQYNIDDRIDDMPTVIFYR